MSCQWAAVRKTKDGTEHNNAPMAISTPGTRRVLSGLQHLEADSLERFTRDGNIVELAISALIQLPMA
jgi:hypothetical protein